VIIQRLIDGLLWKSNASGCLVDLLVGRPAFGLGEEYAERAEMSVKGGRECV
jgi:hypothetical protein